LSQQDTEIEQSVHSCIFTNDSTYNPFTEQSPKYFSMPTSAKKKGGKNKKVSI